MASEACKELPPVTAEYNTKGSYETIAGFKTYVVGPADATRAIIDVYDVFGMAPQTLQGADRLSEHLNVLVLVPDFFEGAAMDESWFPPNTDEKKALLQRFLDEKASLGVVDSLIKVRKEVGEKWPGVDDHVGVFGLCFGGKIAVLACGSENEGKHRKFTVSGTAHPSRLDAKDAEAHTVPHICLASPGEPADVVAEYKEIFSKPGRVGVVETYTTMFHGWMGARANLAKEDNLAEYERGYKQVAEFFNAHL